MEFVHLRREVMRENAEQSIDWKRSIRLDDEGTIDRINRWLTPHMAQKFKAGALTLEDAKKSAIKRIEADYAKRLEKKLSRLALVENAAPLLSIDISVEWKKNRAWGMNPTALVRARVAPHSIETGTGTASGCGYDKQSAAISGALNQCTAILLPLYQCAENLGARQEEYREKIGYGTGYDVLPYFEGGVGVSCYPRIFEAMGYTWNSIASGDSFDVYTVTKN